MAEVITAHSNENVETQLDNATDAPDTLLGSVPTASDSLADENVCHVSCSNVDKLIKEFFV